MTDDCDIAILLEDFPELKNPGIDLSKEVLAHFGLLFSAFALLEASLQNCYVFWGLRTKLFQGEITSTQMWEVNHEELEARAFSATLGTLLNKYLKDCEDLSGIKGELLQLKKARDYFAHHFFREENRMMHTEHGNLILLSRMNLLRRRVRSSEQGTDEIGKNIFYSVFPEVDIDAQVDKYAQDAKAEFIKHPSEKVGWEHDA